MWWFAGWVSSPPEAPAADPPQAIVGGTELPSGEGPVAALVDEQGAVICTATLIAPRWMLTAAHCLGPLGFDLLGQPVPDGLSAGEARWGTDLVRSAPVETRALISAVAHPELDLALVELDAEPSAAPAVLVSVPPAPGQPLVATGFGSVSDLGEGLGVLRSTRLDVLEVEPELLHTWTAGANLCSGDSGAPLSVPGTDPLALVAVAFQVEPTCLGGGAIAVRMDAALDFVSSYTEVATLPTLPEPDIAPIDTGAPTPDPRQPPLVLCEPRSERGCASAPQGPPSGSRLAWVLLACLWARAGARGSRS